MLASPTPTWLLLLGLSLPDLLSVLLRNSAYLVLVALVSPQLIAQAAPLSAIVVVLVSLFSFAALGLLGAAFTLYMRRSNPIATLIGGLSVVAGGVLYPAAVMPQWLQLAGGLLPISPALEALRGALLDGAPLSSLGGALLRLSVFAAVMLPLSAWAFARALRRARDDGSLSAY